MGVKLTAVVPSLLGCNSEAFLPRVCGVRIFHTVLRSQEVTFVVIKIEFVL